jgi:hypothetical protein
MVERGGGGGIWETFNLDPNVNLNRVLIVNNSSLFNISSKIKYLFLKTAG